MDFIKLVLRTYDTSFKGKANEMFIICFSCFFIDITRSFLLGECNNRQLCMGD